MFGGTPVERSRYEGFRRNVAIAIANLQRPALTGSVKWNMGLRFPALVLLSLRRRLGRSRRSRRSRHRHFYNLQYDQALADFRRYVSPRAQRPERFQPRRRGESFTATCSAPARSKPRLVSGNQSVPPPRQGERQPRRPARIRLQHRARHGAVPGPPEGESARYRRALRARISYGLRGNYDFLVPPKPGAMR